MAIDAMAASLTLKSPAIALDPSRDIAHLHLVLLRRAASGWDVLDRDARADVLLIAAAAQDVGVDVLHYDRHYDRPAQALRFNSIWIAPAGTLEEQA
jgi:hypothetical protein